MDTVKNLSSTEIDKSHLSNSESAARDAQHKILQAISANTNHILVTSKSNEGKTKLLQFVARNISDSYRIIFFKANNLSKSSKYELEDKETKHYKKIQNFIYESSKLEEPLIVFIDAADYLPNDILLSYLNLDTKNNACAHTACIVMSAAPDFKTKLDNLGKSLKSKPIYISLDEEINKSSLLKQKKLAPQPAIVGEETKSNSVPPKQSVESEHMPVQWLPKSKISKRKSINFPPSVIVAIILAVGLIFVINFHPSNTNQIDKELTKNTPLIEDGTRNHDSVQIDLTAETNLDNYQIESTSFDQDTQKKLTHNEKVATGTDSLLVEETPHLNSTLENDSVDDEQSSITDEKLNVQVTEIAAEVETAEVETAEVETAEVETAEVETAEVETAEVETAEVETAEVETAEVETAQIMQPDGITKSIKFENNFTEIPSKNKNMNALLTLAAKQIEEKKLTTPAVDNAYSTYQTILTIAPDHIAALQGIEEIKARYIKWANHELKQRNTGHANYLFKKANEVHSESSNINIEQTTKPSVATSTQEKSNYIENLLMAAKERIENNHLTTPTNKNAYSYYKKILSVEPNNVYALDGITQIKQIYTNWAIKEENQNRKRRAVLFYEKALAIDPNDEKIQLVLNKLKS